MEFFTSGFFWFLEGILFVIVLLAVRVWTEDQGIPMPYWKWMALVVWMALLGFTIAFVGTSLGENEADAAVRGGILFGIVVAISGVGLWRLIKTGSETGDEGDRAGPEEQPA